MANIEGSKLTLFFTLIPYRLHWSHVTNKHSRGGSCALHLI